MLRNDIRGELVYKGFKCYEGEVLSDLVSLKSGDILVRNNHVEFYLGENHSFGWREIHSTYENKDESKYYKQKHPKIYYGEAFDYWYEFNYDYGIGVDEESKEVCVVETKTVSRIFVEDGFEKMLQ